MRKKITEIVLVLCMLCTFVPSVSAAAIVDNGQCGDNITYKLDSDGTLTISGKGDMWYYGLNDKPWIEHTEEIKKAVISEGVTGMGGGIFAGCKNLKDVTIPNTITEIAPLSFYGCSSLRHIEMPNQVTSIGVLKEVQENGLKPRFLRQTQTML